VVRAHTINCGEVPAYIM